jgi:outer membrane protein OmpA-like peptidoglycan-associated protein
MPPGSMTGGDVPWKVIGASPDMMDVTVGNRRFPYTWRSSVAVSVFEPPMDDERAAELCGQRLTFVKVTCSITGYQPSGSEPSGTVTFQDRPLEELERLTSEYLACYGALLNVAFFPQGERNTTDLSRLPRILDFTPKSRELIRSISESGEILTGSTRDLKFDASRTTTEKNETTVGLEAGVSASGFEAKGSISHTWGTTQEDKRGMSVGTGASEQAAQRYATTMDQLYSLLTGYHAGTNRATCIMLARPGTLQATDRRTFAPGLRMLEGIQDFIFIVSRPADVDGLCVEVALDTGHFPEDAPLSGEERPSETTTFTYNVFYEAHGLTGVVPPYRGEEILIGERDVDTFPLPSDERGAWELDWVEDPREAIRQGEDRTRIRGIGGPTPTDGILTHEGHRTIPVRAVPGPDNRSVRFMTTATIHARGAELGREHRVDTIVDKDFIIHARRPREFAPERVADPSVMLVTRRGLTACYRSEDGCPVVVDPPEAIELDLPHDWWERSTGLGRPTPGSLEAAYSRLHSALVSGAAGAARGEPPRSFAETDYFARKVRRALAPDLASSPLAAALDLTRWLSSADAFGNATVGDVLAAPLRDIRRLGGLDEAKAIELRGEVLVALDGRLRRGPAAGPIIGSREIDDGIRLTLPVDLLFDFDSDELQAHARASLALAAAEIRHHPDAPVRVVGHTDGRGSDDYNQALAERRATTVVDALAKSHGIDRGRLTPIGRGSGEPVAHETYPDGRDDPAGRQRNRRVEIEIVTKGGPS